MGDLISIRTIKDALDATILAGEAGLDSTVEHIYASDLMSDVLAFGKSNSILLTGLATKQSIISSFVAEFKGVVFIRGKVPKDGSDIFARDKQLVLLSTKLDMYDACLRIAAAMNRKLVPTPPAVSDPPEEQAEILLRQEFIINGNDFSNAGMVSTELNEVLKKIGYPSQVVRRAAISTYEGELNVIMHARRGHVTLLVSPKYIEVTIADEGPGIPDIEQAMQEGFTTATEEMRAMGFGSGMGLPNIKRNATQLKIDSTVGVGTTLRMRFEA